MRLFALVLLTSIFYGVEVKEVFSDICTADTQYKCGDLTKKKVIDDGVAYLREKYGVAAEDELLAYIGDYSKPGEQLVGAAIALKYFATNKSLDKMIDAMGHLPSGMMDAAADIVSANDSVGLSQKIADIYVKEEDEDRKARLDYVMCNISGKSQFQVVMKWANGVDVDFKRRGVSSLRNYSNEVSRKIVVRSIFDDNEKVVYNAIASLGYVGVKEDMLILQYMLVKAGKLKGLDQIAMMSAVKDSGQRIKDRLDGKK